MVRISRILRDYQDAGSVNGLLSLWGFVDDWTFLTKAGHVGLVYHLRGVDYEGLSHPQRHALVHRFEAGLRLLDEHCRVYQYLLKRTVAPFNAGTCSQPIANEAIQRRAAYLNGRRQDLYDLSLYLVLLYEAPHVLRRSTKLQGLWAAPREAVRAWLSSDHALQAIESELDRAIGALHHKAQGFEVQISDFAQSGLRKSDAFRFFRELLNYNPAVVDAARLTHDTHLDYFVSDSSVDCHRDHLLVGDRIVKVLTTKEPPSQTFAFLLQDLYEIPGEFIACLEWQRIASDRMRRDVQSRRRHFFNKRVSLVNYVAPETRPEEMLVDDSANATVRQLGDALTELEVNGHFFGHCSLTLVLHGTEPRALQHQTAEAMKAMAVHDGSLFEETYNLLNAWLAIVPGNGAHNLRRLALLETNVADLSFPVHAGSW
jgi:type IV secretory pathway VirB4 component